MSKIDDAIRDLKNEAARTRRKGYSHATVVGLLELETLLAWAEKVPKEREGLVALITGHIEHNISPVIGWLRRDAQLGRVDDDQQRLTAFHERVIKAAEDIADSVGRTED